MNDEIITLKARVKLLEDALKNLIGYASLVGSETDDVHIAAVKHAKDALRQA